MSDIYGIAKSGLQAYKSLATTGQNIANVGNENYVVGINLTEVRSATAKIFYQSSNTS